MYVKKKWGKKSKLRGTQTNKQTKNKITKSYVVLKKKQQTTTTIYKRKISRERNKIEVKKLEHERKSARSVKAEFAHV